MDLPLIGKTATYYSQCDHLNMENTTVGGPCLVNVLEFNMKGGLRVNFLSAHSTQ